MTRATNRWITFGAMLFLGLSFLNLSGCNYFKLGADDDSDLADIDDVEKAAPIERSSLEKADNEHLHESPPLEGHLELKLNVGDKFPLSKTVEQALVQSDRSGDSISSSLTEMMLSLVVDKIQPDGRKQLTVHYHRVRYRQDIRGKQITYSSDSPSEQIPPEALVYSGLANNGFSFWIGPNNKVVEIVDFKDFLRRCLRNVPTQYVATVQQQMESIKSEDGIANFIDDSIGLLPYSSDPNHPSVAIKEGMHWDLEPRYSDKPFPIFSDTRCTLKELSTNAAEIMLSGKISGRPNGFVVPTPEGDLKIIVKDGNSTGSCRVDRKTGLPTQSRVIRSLVLAMEMPDGQKIQQDKKTISTITSFLDQNQQAASNGTRRVQQTGFPSSAGNENHRRVIHAGGTNPN